MRHDNLCHRSNKTELFQETLCQAEPSASRRNLDINWHWRVSESMRLAVCNACGIEHQSRGVLTRRKQSAAPGLRCEWLDDGIICHQYHRQHHGRIRETFGVSWACTAPNPHVSDWRFRTSEESSKKRSKRRRCRLKPCWASDCRDQAWSLHARIPLSNEGDSTPPTAWRGSRLMR